MDVRQNGRLLARWIALRIRFFTALYLGPRGNHVVLVKVFNVVAVLGRSPRSAGGEGRRKLHVVVGDLILRPLGVLLEL